VSVRVLGLQEALQLVVGEPWEEEVEVAVQGFESVDSFPCHPHPK